MKQLEINPKEDLFFDLKVREMCKSCKRFGKKATCPPRIESVEYYSKLLPQYEHGIIYYEKFYVGNGKYWIEKGKKSSLEIYEKVIHERNKLIAVHGHYFFIAFGAGSCKLCDECLFPCRNPQESLIPFEATGIDIVKVMGKQGILIKFPIKTTFYRIGALFYD